MKFGLVIFGLFCTASGGALADPERARIGAERVTANAKLAQEQRECATRFIVAACVDDARTAHRETSQRLRQQELQLDETARRAAAEGRRKAIAEKAQSSPTRASDASPDSPRVHMRRAAPTAPTAPTTTMLDAGDPAGQGGAPRLPSKASQVGSRSAVEQLQQQKFEARQREAKAHRAAVAQRNALRAASGKIAAPLQVPSAPR